MKKALKSIAVGLCLGLLLLSVLSVVLLAAHADHDCHGGYCGVCAAICCLSKMLQQLGAVAAVALLLWPAAVYLRGAVAPGTSIRKTPILLKVQMNN